MAANVGGSEKAIRIILGIGLLALGWFGGVTGGWAIAAYAVGAIALITGLIGFCPAWAVLHVNTCRGARTSAK